MVVNKDVSKISHVFFENDKSESDTKDIIETSFLTTTSRNQFFAAHELYYQSNNVFGIRLILDVFGKTQTWIACALATGQCWESVAGGNSSIAKLRRDTTSNSERSFLCNFISKFILCGKSSKKFSNTVYVHIAAAFI